MAADGSSQKMQECVSKGIGKCGARENSGNGEKRGKAPKYGNDEERWEYREGAGSWSGTFQTGFNSNLSPKHREWALLPGRIRRSGGNTGKESGGMLIP